MCQIPSDSKRDQRLFQVSWSLAERPSSPAPVTLKPVQQTSENMDLVMESSTNSRKDPTSTTEETTRRKVLQELVEMTTKRKEVSSTRRKSMGTIRRGNRPLSQRAALRRRLDNVLTNSSSSSRPPTSILPSSTPRPRMVRPSYRGAGGRDRVGQWERKVAPKKPLRRMKIRGGGPSNR